MLICIEGNTLTHTTHTTRLIMAATAGATARGMQAQGGGTGKPHSVNSEEPSTQPSNSFEAERDARVARNLAEFRARGLEPSVVPPKEPRPKRHAEDKGEPAAPVRASARQKKKRGAQPETPGVAEQTSEQTGAVATPEVSEVGW